MNKKAFTLIEVLIVVLIIAILAAIAVPQYQIVVGKTRLTELKSVIRNIYYAEQRYYLLNNSYPTSIDDLDISFDVKSKYTYKVSPYREDKGYKFTISNGIKCDIWYNSITCDREIYGQSVQIYAYRDKPKKHLCAVFGGKDPNTIASKLCRKETGHPTQCTSYCHSYY